MVVLVGGMRAVQSTFWHLRSCFECECVVLVCEGAAGVRVLRARERKKQTSVLM